MEISDRKKKILQAVVNDYIEKAEPVSSFDIQSKYLPDYSTATIRNELVELNNLGYLEQPHASSGRVPTQLAYNLYVDKLMEKKPLSKEEIEQIESYFSEELNDIESIVKNAAKAICDITNYPAVMLPKKSKNEVIKNIKLVQITQDKALIIIITDMRVLKDNEIKLKGRNTDTAIDNASRLLNRVFAGLKMKDLDTVKMDVIAKDVEAFGELFGQAVKVLKNVSMEYEKTRDAELLVEGSSKIYNYPEFNDPERARNFMAAIETKEKLASVVGQADDIEVSVNIEKDTDMSIVSAKYTINGKDLGSAGVIGPIRMDYNKVISVLDYIGKTIDKITESEENNER